MLNRLEQHAPGLPFFFQMHECADKSHEAYDAYEGAGAAIILTCGDDIIHLVYVEDDYQAARQVAAWYRSYKDEMHRVWFGMCSCTQFCDPMLIERKDAKFDRRVVRDMIVHGKNHRFMGYD